MPIFLGFVFAATFLFFFSLPYLNAIADMHEITYEPVQRCGPRCVIETKGFDGKDEADEFANHVFHGKVYQIKDTKLYFVDYQVTEMEAK